MDCLLFRIPGHQSASTIYHDRLWPAPKNLKNRTVISSNCAAPSLNSRRVRKSSSQVQLLEWCREYLVAVYLPVKSDLLLIIYKKIPDHYTHSYIIVQMMASRRPSFCYGHGPAEERHLRTASRIPR